MSSAFLFPRGSMPFLCPFFWHSNLRDQLCFLPTLFMRCCLLSSHKKILLLFTFRPQLKIQRGVSGIRESRNFRIAKKFKNVRKNANVQNLSKWEQMWIFFFLGMLRKKIWAMPFFSSQCEKNARHWFHAKKTQWCVLRKCTILKSNWLRLMKCQNTNEGVSMHFLAQFNKIIWMHFPEPFHDPEVFWLKNSEKCGESRKFAHRKISVK